MQVRAPPPSSTGIVGLYRFASCSGAWGPRHSQRRHGGVLGCSNAFVANQERLVSDRWFGRQLRMAATRLLAVPFGPRHRLPLEPHCMGNMPNMTHLFGGLRRLGQIGMLGRGARYPRMVSCGCVTRCVTGGGGVSGGGRGGSVSGGGGYDGEGGGAGISGDDTSPDLGDSFYGLWSMLSMRGGPAAEAIRHS